MDRQDNESLHQKASGHYLEGEYDEALELWRALRNQAPEDERASEGIRLCEMMSESREEPLDPEPAASDIAPEDAVEQVILDLEELPTPSDNPPSSSDDRLDAAAATELIKRKDELLAEVRAARSENRLDDATGILARLFILEEGNEEGRALEAEIRELVAGAAIVVEDKIAEAVQWMENDRLEDAEVNLRQVLDLSPDHKEAEHYLEQVLQRLEQVAEPDEDPAATIREHGAVDLDTGDAEDIALSSTVSEAESLHDELVDETALNREFPGLDEDVGTRSAKGPGLFAGRNLIVAVVVLVLAAVGWYFGRGLLSGDPTPASTTAEEATVLSDRSTEDLIREAEALSGEAAIVSRESTEMIPGMIQRAVRQMGESDYASAVITWDMVLELDPSNVDARRGIEDAGRLYREQKERSADVVRARYLFEEGDYSSALKILYRLPEDIQPERVQVCKVNGWYNLAVISLKAGRIEQAVERFREIELLEVNDPEATEYLAFSESYLTRPKDRAFYRDVNDLKFRSFDGK